MSLWGMHEVVGLEATKDFFSAYGTFPSIRLKPNNRHYMLAL